MPAPTNGNEAMLKKAQELMARGEFPDDVSGQMLWAGMLAQNAMFGKLLDRVKRLEWGWAAWVAIGIPTFVYFAKALMDHVAGR